MADLWWWSWLLTGVGVAGLLLAGSKRKLGWMLGLLAQVLWIIYAIVSTQYGFLASALLYGAVYARNWITWRKSDRLNLEPKENS